MSLPASEVFDRFDIEFDAGEEPIFHGGELITGSIKARLKQQITIKVIRIQFKGRACWLGDHSKNAEIEKLYFDKDFVLLERPPGRPEPGNFPWIANFTYSLPFEFPLPKGCPTSYENPQAFIRYFARATLITDEIDATQYVVKKGFTIISPPELHELLPPPSNPIEIEEVTTWGSCCCRSKITTKLNLPKTAYAPGERIIGTFTINNRNPKILDQIEVKLVDVVTRADTTNDEKRKKNSNRVLILRKLDKIDIEKGKGPLEFNQVHLLTIPSISSTTIQPEPSIPSSPEIKLNPDNQASKLLESPSTATLKMRKKPFLKINYILQLSLGNKILIEIPINIHPIPIYEHGVEFKSFICGLQNFHESDEIDKNIINPPFRFEPKYPIYVNTPPNIIELTNEPEHELAVTSNGDVELNRSVEINDLPNGDQIILSKEEMVIVHNEEKPTTTTPPPTITTTPTNDEKDSDSVIIHDDQHDDNQNHTNNIQTEEYDEGDSHVEKTIETYSYTDDNGVRVEVQKTTESTVIHHESPINQDDEHNNDENHLQNEINHQKEQHQNQQQIEQQE